jgi:hypothetical protein
MDESPLAKYNYKEVAKQFDDIYKLIEVKKWVKIIRLEEGHNSYPLVCRRPAETVSLQRRQICYRWGTPAYWSLGVASQVCSIKTLDFSTLYTTLPHDILKTSLTETIHIGDGKVAKIIGFGMAKQLDQDVLKMGLY